MIGALIQFLVCAGIIVAAGTFLTRYADAIADITKLGRLLIGSILVAGATSLPELSVDINAVRMGLADVAVGDLMGSSLFNLLILAGLDLWHQSRGRMLSRAAAAHALSATLAIALTGLAALAILIGHDVPVSVSGIGVGTIGIVLAYALGVRLVFHDQRVSAQEAALATGHPQSVLVPAGRLTLTKAILGFLVAAAVILVAAPRMAESAGQIAESTGLGGTFVGTTLVALSTSLPELVASVIAVRMGAFDLAAGNIFGSNTFNMILLAPLDVVQDGPLLAAVSPTHAVTALCTIIVTSVAVLGQLYQVETRKRLIEPDAWLMITLILGSLALVYSLG